MTPKLHFEEEDQDQEKECLDFQDVEEIPRGRRLIVVRRSRVIAMEEVFEVSVVDEEDNGANAEAESETAEAAASADSNLSLKTLKCKRCGCLQQFEVAAAAVEDADSDEKSQVSPERGSSPGPDPDDTRDDLQSSTVSQTTESPSNIIEERGPNGTTFGTSIGTSIGPRVIPIPKWRVREEPLPTPILTPSLVDPGTPTTSAPKRRYDAGSLDPKSKKGRVTLQTNDGPIEVSVLPHKAERREGTCKFVCPVPNCNFRKEGSRVFIAKHFRVVHKDYRSWRDLFLDKNAPPIVAVEREIIGGGEEGDKVDEEEEEEEGESEEVDCETPPTVQIPLDSRPRGPPPPVTHLTDAAAVHGRLIPSSAASAPHQTQDYVTPAAASADTDAASPAAPEAVASAASSAQLQPESSNFVQYQPHVVVSQEVPQPYVAATTVGLDGTVGLAGTVGHHQAVFQPPQQQQQPQPPQPRYKMIQVAVPASVASQINSGAQRYQLVPMAAMAAPPPQSMLPPPMVAAPPLMQQQPLMQPVMQQHLMQQSLMQQPLMPQHLMQQPYPPPGSVLVPMYPF